MAIPDSQTDFDFLPKLPKADLDDRTFEDLVEECLLRIPRYCPEWTNYNPGDPGVTLIELFAWLVHQMLYRFNQVPRRHYVAFLELLGIRLLPPTPARTELTFYLTQAQTTPRRVPQGTEVATVRTENQEAVIFTTDRDLTMRQPQVRHLLLAQEATPTKEPPPPETLLNPFRGTASEQTGNWSDLETTANLLMSCQPGNCFYLVLTTASAHPLEPTDEATPNDLAGNVIALTFRGPAAVTTGIDPNNPPLEWQVWDGDRWQSGILRVATDDQTKGFSFDQLGQTGPNPEQEGADVILHLPQHWPITNWGNYEGRWIRCVYIPVNAEQQQFGYDRSPEITGLSVRTIGGVVSASECIQLSEELIGTSNGKPGQAFQLSRRPILHRRPEEHIEIRLPNGTPQRWQEVPDFGDSTAEDPHYTIDNESGTVQFGPLIREPHQLRQQTQERSQVQSWGRPVQVRRSLTTAAIQESSIPAVLEAVDRQAERQYGQVPPMGAEIYMRGYRTGGGSQGNVQAGQLTVLKSAIPYIKSVTNYAEAVGGREAESLEEAMIRVPALLRTRETALTPEEFEHKARQFQFYDGTAVARAHCITTEHLITPGVIRLLIVPTLPDYRRLAFKQGVSPAQLQLSTDFQRSLQAHLNQHRALGIRVTLEAPEYVGIKVRAQVYLSPPYSRDRAPIADKIKTALYRFLNPLIGGADGQGWPRGRSVESSDIIALIQQVPEVHSVAQVHLLALRPYRHQGETGWMLVPTPQPKIELGELAIATAWEEDSELNPGHEIEFLDL